MLDEIIWEVIEPFGDGKPHRLPYDPPDLPGDALGSLAEELDTGIGHEGVFAPGDLEAILKKRLEPFSFVEWLDLRSHLDATGQRGIDGPVDRLGEGR